MKSIKKLKLNKQIVANLSNMEDIHGGESATIGEDCNTIGTLIPGVIGFITKFTKGNCDIPSIGHDDGDNCLSKEANWCHGI